MSASTGPSGGEDVASTPTFIGESSGAVGFLDAAGADGVALRDAVRDAVADLEPGSVLTVYVDRRDARDAIDLACDRHRLDVVATIDHPRGGTTVTLRVAD